MDTARYQRLVRERQERHAAQVRLDRQKRREQIEGVVVALFILGILAGLGWFIRSNRITLAPPAPAATQPGARHGAKGGERPPAVGRTSRAVGSEQPIVCERSPRPALGMSAGGIFLIGAMVGAAGMYVALGLYLARPL